VEVFYVFQKAVAKPDVKTVARVLILAVCVISLWIFWDTVRYYGFTGIYDHKIWYEEWSILQYLGFLLRMHALPLSLSFLALL